MTQPARRVGTRLTMLALLLVAIPGIGAQLHRAPAASDVPPALDSFLAAVARHTPAYARLLAIGEPPALLLYRATYLLYPRHIETAQSTEYAQTRPVAPPTWPTITRLARRARAQYIITWALDMAPRDAVRLRMDRGVLAEAPRG